MNYAFPEISVNNRTVVVEDILSKAAYPKNKFEEALFLFVRDWISGVPIVRQFTSGSTGAPKEIELSRHHLQQSAVRTITALGLQTGDAALLCLDPQYIAGKMMLVRALEGGMKIIGVDPVSNPFKKVEPTTPISFAALIPMQLQEIVKDAESVKQLNQLKAVIVGGGAVSDSLLQSIKKLTCPVFATYGMTETVSHIALQRLNGPEASDYFTTLPGIQITLDTRGCLTIQMPEFPEPIVTNDLVELLSPTAFRWLGRMDHVINSGGFKISPERIEQRIETTSNTLHINRPFFICGVPDERLGQKVILAIEGFPVYKEKKILPALTAHLHPYEVPKKIMWVREFIRTETGKINRLKTTELITH
jgi:O-succinylbenzoic acid--CoA ligase